MYRLAPSLAAALPVERRVLACRGWAGENEAFLSILCSFLNEAMLFHRGAVSLVRIVFL